MNGLLIALALLVPQARPASSLALGNQYNFTGFEVSVTKGDRVGGEHYRQAGFWLVARGGILARPEATTFGTRLGLEYELRVGVTPDEEDPARDGPGVGCEVAAGVPMAFYISRGKDVMLLFVAGARGGFGGGHWWSDTPRFSASGGLRLALRPTKWLRMEFDYTGVPIVLTGSPDPLDVRRVEHHMSLSMGLWNVGLRSRVTVFNETVTGAASGTVRSSGYTLGTSVEWRFGS